MRIIKNYKSVEKITFFKKNGFWKMVILLNEKINLTSVQFVQKISF